MQYCAEFMGLANSWEGWSKKQWIWYLLDVAHIVVEHCTVLRLFLGVQHSRSSHCCSSLHPAPPLTPSAPVMSTHIRLTCTAQNPVHTTLWLKRHTAETMAGSEERKREKGRGSPRDALILKDWWPLLLLLQCLIWAKINWNSASGFWIARSAWSSFPQTSQMH